MGKERWKQLGRKRRNEVGHWRGGVRDGERKVERKERGKL